MSTLMYENSYSPERRAMPGERKRGRVAEQFLTRSRVCFSLAEAGHSESKDGDAREVMALLARREVV